MVESKVIKLKAGGEEKLTNGQVDSSGTVRAQIVGDWTYVRAGNDLLCFEFSGGKYVLRKRFDGLFTVDDNPVDFPWTVFHKSDSEKFLIVRTMDGISSFNISGSKAGIENKINTEENTMIQAFDEQHTSRIRFLTSSSKNGMLVLYEDNQEKDFYKFDSKMDLDDAEAEKPGGDIFELSGKQEKDAAEFVALDNGVITKLTLENENFKKNALNERSDQDLNSSCDKIFYLGINRVQIFIVPQEQGLAVFKLEGRNLQQICLNQQFSVARGWAKEHWDTVRVVENASKGYLVFTGPNGVGVFQIPTSECGDEHSRIEDSILPLELRHGIVLNAKFLGDELKLLVKNANQVSSLTTILESVLKDIPSTVELQDTSTTLKPEYDSSLKLNEKSAIQKSLWLGETLDTSSIIDAVDRTTGRLSFTLPIIDFSSKFGIPIKHTFYYDPRDEQEFLDAETGGVLGRHWSMSADYIYVDRKQSVFEEAFEYFLVNERNKLVLERVSSSESEERFVLNGTEVIYHKRAAAKGWEIKLKDVTYRYGMDDGSVRWTFGWPNWNGKGTVDAGLQRLPLEWHLSQVATNQGSGVVKYTYESDFADGTNAISATKGIFLSRIEDKEENVSVSFKYESKPDQNKPGNSGQKFDTDKLFEDRKYLTNIKVINNDVFHDIKLEYNNRKTHLEKIIDGAKSLLEMTYSNNYLKSIQIPGSNIAYNYEHLLVPKDKLKTKFNIDTQIYFESSYVITSKLSMKRTIELEIYDIKSILQDDRKPVWSQRVSTDEDVRSVSVTTKPRYFLVIAQFEKAIKLVMFVKDEDGIKDWKKNDELNYQKQIDMNPQDQYCLIIYEDDNGDSQLVLYDDFDKKEYNLQGLKHFGLTFVHKGIIYYDINGVHIVRYNDKFIKTTIATENFVDSTIDVPNKFDVPELLGDPDFNKKYIGDLQMSLAGGGIAMLSNMLFIRQLKLEGTNIESTVNMYLLDSRYNIISQKTNIIKPGTIQIDKEIRLTFNPRGYINTEHHYLFKFEKNKNDKWTLAIKEHNTTVTDKDEYNTVIPALLRIPLNFDKLSLFRMGDSVICGSKSFSYDGNQFKTIDVDETELKLHKINVQIAKNVWLTKESKDGPVKLSSEGQSKSTTSLETPRLDHLHMKLPTYVSYKKIDGSNYVVKLENGGTTVGERIRGAGKILVSSTPLYLLTNETTHIGVTPIQAVQASQTIKTTVITSEQRMSASTKYEYDVNSASIVGNQVGFQKVNIFPYKDNTFGSFEQTTNFTDKSRVVRVLDSKGQSVVENYKGDTDANTADQSSTTRPICVLFDRFGINPIVNFEPMELSSEQVDFIGFERYEKLDGRKWNIDVNSIVRDRFSGTGNSFYQLKNAGQQFKGEFSMKNFQQTHVVSAWIRSNKGFEMDKTSKILTVAINGKSIEGVVKDQINEWYYIEALIEPTEGSVDLLKQKQQSIKITFKTDSNPFLDIDHVRLSPLSLDVEAIIYDEYHPRPIAKLNNNGRTSQILYDDYGRKVGEIDQRGSVGKLLTYSRKPVIAQSADAVESMVQLQPTAGFLETFSPHTLKLNWNVDSVNDWKFSSKRVKHENGKTHKLTFKKSIENATNVGLRFKVSRENVKGQVSIDFQSGTLQTQDSIESLAFDVVILFYKNFQAMWIDGVLKKTLTGTWDPKQNLYIKVSGSVEISELIVLWNVDAVVEYNNFKGQPLQQITVEDDQHLAIRGYLYDEIGRQVVETVWQRIEISKSSNKIFDYRENFIQANNGQSISGSIVTETSTQYANFPFKQTQYLDCPLEIRTKSGLPGKENNIDSNRAIAYSRGSNNAWLQLLFPLKKGFRYEQQQRPNKATTTLVFDNQDRRVAHYESVPSYENVLTTYRYDDKGNVVEELPPNFHNDVQTTANSNELDVFLNGLVSEKNASRYAWRVFKEYDANNRLVLKKTPDAGKYRYLYNDLGQLRFVQHFNLKNEIQKTFYHKYTSTGKVFEFGLIDENSTGDLDSKLVDLTYPPSTKNFIRLDYGEEDLSTFHRGRKHYSLKVDDRGDQTSEVVYYDGEGNVIGKSYLHPTELNSTVDLSFSYERNNIAAIGYPFEFLGSSLIVTYRHNLRGEVTAIGIPNQLDRFATVRHDPRGKVEEILSLPKDVNRIRQTFAYDAAGNMIKINSDFLDEILDYEKGGVRDNDAGDGSILRTTFEAKWHNKSSPSGWQLRAANLLSYGLKSKKSIECFKALISENYVSNLLKPIKVLKDTAIKELSFSKAKGCFESPNRKILAKYLMEKGFPEKYGHAYDYGNHGELTQAKFFIGPESKVTTESNEDSPGDVLSLQIDPNGNHKLFYTGLERFEIQYEIRTNKIKSVKRGALGKATKFDHDSAGNVIQAEYKNITKIEYDYLLDRASKINLNDGTEIQLSYDIRGERTVKKVIYPNGTSKEVYYIRDTKGRCLVDITFNYTNKKSQKPLVILTAYIYGPLGLLGFIRNNVFYSVLADHEGSTRLVVKNGEVVAAYDYLPYGQRQRHFRSDPDGYLDYQYTGQEFDEETGLYNYHARLYDPELGRFYQVDPQEQYPSPYKYAGNSPVMMVDPDGELALLIACIIFAILGAYLGGASVNENWNPLKWNWKSGYTYLGIIGGGVAGALLPIGGVASFGYLAAIGGTAFATFATITIAAAGAYLGMASAANDWNPANFDFTSPSVYSGMLQGASMAVNIPSGAVGVARTMAGYATKGKIIYMIYVQGTSTLLGYVMGSFANNMTWNPAKWNWNPKTIFAIAQGSTAILMGSSGTLKHGPKKQFFQMEPVAAPKSAVQKFGSQMEKFYKVRDEIAVIKFQKAKMVAKSIMKKREPYGHYVRGPPLVVLAQIGEFVSVPRLFGGMMLHIGIGMNHLFKFKQFYEKFTEGFTRKTRSVELPPVTSSGSKTTNLFIDVINQVNWITSTSSERQQSDHFTPITDLDNPSEGTPNKKAKAYAFVNCYSIDPSSTHFTCYQSAGRVEIFPKDPSMISSTNNAIPMDNCVPFHWYDQPSIGCQGKEFSFIYTPYERTRFFTFLDGWLLLARVALSVVQNKESKKISDRIPFPELKLSFYREQLDDIGRFLDKHGSKPEWRWAKLQLADMKQDLYQFAERGTISSDELTLFDEQISALREDSEEQFYFMKQVGAA
ncbi:uncharacterized protein LOC129748970 [Uranotaenia lowii]|uniref:uncharacterized protein LOC129748970 n=1 Tax=Uranotaenia lowii TaxID=190385 RepID=UPI0024799D94|nr:uncharacterized protein LOC129748970 [Uranotaenia lowii]